MPKKVVAKKAPVTRPTSGGKKVATPKVSGLSVPVYSLLGKASGTYSLPKEIFGKAVNKKLLAQAMRIYMTNEKSFLGKTKTRGEVEGSSVKIFRQKGTGRARHGSVRAPIFVGGGIVFGPQVRKVRLNMPQKMKKAALFAALSSKLAEKQIVGLSGLDKASGKTKEIVHLLEKIAGPKAGGKTQSTLIVTGERMESSVRGAKNIAEVDSLPANLINAYEVLKHDMLLITKEAIEKLANPKEISKA